MEPSPEVKAQILATELIGRDFLAAISFIVGDTGRDPTFAKNHLLSYLAQDYIESIVGLMVLVKEGVHNPCRRELRFLLEMSIKLCKVEQEDRSSVANKLNQFKDLFSSTNISMRNDLKLELLPPTECAAFHSEVGKIYGETSGYVHLADGQVLRRMNKVDAKRVVGFETPEEVADLNTLIARALACDMVFLLHAVPSWVAGDLLVRSDGASMPWIFCGSRFIAHIDEYFDYKAERQKNLNEIKKRRWSSVNF